MKQLQNGSEDFFDLTDLVFPDVLSTLLSPIDATNCASYSAEESYQALIEEERLKDMMALKTIVNKGWGCVRCDSDISAATSGLA